MPAETFTYDYSFGRPIPREMKAAGAAGVERYGARRPNPKVLSVPERDLLFEAGLSITWVWELGEQRALAGFDAGYDDARYMLDLAHELGTPPGAGIYYVLEDPRPVARSQWPAVLRYVEGVRHAGGPFRVGGYGGQALVEEATRQGLITLGWQVEGWSQSVSPACHLYQRSNSRNHPFPSTDENVCLQSDWGQWPQDHLPDPIPTPPQEDEVVKAVIVMNDGTEYAITDELPPRRWHIPDEPTRDLGVMLGLWHVAPPGPSDPHVQDLCNRMEIITKPLS